MGISIKKTGIGIQVYQSVVKTLGIPNEDEFRLIGYLVWDTDEDTYSFEQKTEFHDRAQVRLAPYELISLGHQAKTLTDNWHADREDERERLKNSKTTYA